MEEDAEDSEVLQEKAEACVEIDVQPEPTEMSVFTDSGWAVCKRSWKSTLGEVILLGDHCVKVWSKTQSVNAKSSA